MADLQISNRLPPLTATAGLSLSGAFGLVTHQGRPIPHDGAPVTVRFSYVARDGQPVTRDGGLVIVRADDQKE